MGDPRRLRKKYSTPRNPWRSDQLTGELFLVGTYGLRNKRELWRLQTRLSRIRKQARMLLAAPAEVRSAEEPKLLTYLIKMGVVSPDASLDNVLGLTVESLLERRLQTVVWRRGLASSPHHARQIITHRHILVGDRIVDVPSYLVNRSEEGSVRIQPRSPILKVALQVAEDVSR